MKIRPFAFGLMVVAGLTVAPVPVTAQGIAGAFLAAREAGIRNDFAHATPYLERLLHDDPENAATLEGAAVSAFSAGDFATATRHATTLAALDPANRASTLILLTDAFAQQDYARALDLASSEAEVHPLIVGLAQAWAELGQGRMSEALAFLDQSAAQEGMTAFAQYCRALALSLVGDVEGALAVMEDVNGGVTSTLNRRGYVAYAQLLGLSERFDDALALMEAVFTGANDPRIFAMDEAYRAQTALPFDLITTPAQGMAEVFAVMANAMRSVQNLHEALIYAQAAVAINPSLTDAQLMIGQIFEDLEQPALAIEAYGRIPEGDVFHMAAGMGQAQVMQTLGQMDEAIQSLTALSEQNPRSFVARQVLGDFLRQDGQYAAAIEAYTSAIAMMTERGITPGWQTWFSRAVAYERSDQWPEAEADFRAALAIEPNQSTTLNYLGYSLVERGESYDEALEMIERAVEIEPSSGYIVDSLAWALFKLGRYDEAVPHMERAVELAPADAILNDHLGDVYWAVGRQREARFQWRRALSFGPSDDLDSELVRRKLEIGLDAVRAEDGQEPLHPVN
ncbi:tetratricopeptide repeat protein [Pararhodobacter sp.]|uniref:tetratricopeptide repeat protein n=1 Tax=Pararhodobacter sp. TaxID=2127056 RepID=UPI002AFF74D6|nr:tetratricopeptide repeat protein [Pararhodobacter sp.]